MLVKISQEVQEALKNNIPVVALESTIISQVKNSYKVPGSIGLQDSGEEAELLAEGDDSDDGF